MLREASVSVMNEVERTSRSRATSSSGEPEMLAWLPPSPTPPAHPAALRPKPLRWLSAWKASLDRTHPALVHEGAR